TTMRYRTLKESLTDRYVQLRDQLNPYYKEDQWSFMPQEFAHTLTDLHKQWNRQTLLRDQLTRQKEELEANQALLSKELEGFEREKTETAKQLQDHSLQLTDLQTQRSTFFKGDPADEVEAKSANELDAISTLHESLSARKLEFDKTRVALETEIKNIKQQIQQATMDSERTKQSIREWLADYAIHHTQLMWDDLETLFALSDEVIARDRNALQLLRDKEIATQTRLSSLQKAIENHRMLPAQIEGADTTQLTQELHDAETKLSVEQQQLMELQLTIRNHSLNLTKRAYIATEIEKSRQIAGEWSKLNEAFGAQNGDKFRKIAMSFTLDLLLSHANHYLRLINDRYQLVRSTDTLQLNVIDTYMADEVRNVASLSGGETFIVSLALALGLSSLASNKLHIETLFIDEGFGSLDSETLQMAMSALSALQEMGRKVGVISHVPEMNEQIYPQIRICPVNSGLSQISIVEY
ncbi:MAG: SbcC/MukB-like Walker B domain-containing protein, partial [Bacteroidales bacterium]